MHVQYIMNVPHIAPAEGFQCPVDFYCGNFSHIWCSECCSLEWYSPQDQHAWGSV